MKIGMISLGCAKNLVDSEWILGMLKKDGHEIVGQIQEADALFINTCGFINDAKKESIQTILEAIQQKKESTYLIVIGCLAKRYKEELQKEIPEIDLIIGVDEYEQIGHLLNQLLHSKLSTTWDINDRVLTSYLPYAYLKIGEGCSNCCAYCAIPLIRGPYYSYPKENILKEAHHLIDMGIKELVIIAQDTTRYGKDLYTNYFLEDLLEEIAQINPNVYIRLLYLYPDRITDRLIQIFKKYDNIFPYFDIPIQHSSDVLLKAMNRTGNRKIYLDVIQKIKKEIPQAVLRTTIIVGFPNETEQDFLDIQEFLKEIEFDHVGIFTYSNEENTKAHELKNKIPKKIANQRKKELLLLQQKISLKKNQNRINQTHLVLIEDYDGNNYYGRSYVYAPDDVDGKVIIKSKKKLFIGDEVLVKITKAYAYDIEGEAQV